MASEKERNILRKNRVFLVANVQIQHSDLLSELYSRGVVTRTELEALGVIIFIYSIVMPPLTAHQPANKMSLYRRESLDLSISIAHMFNSQINFDPFTFSSTICIEQL